MRFDATAYITNAYGKNNDPGSDIPEGWSLLQWINNEIRARQPWKITIAEDLRNNEWITKDTGAGGAGFDAQWASQFLDPFEKRLLHQEIKTVMCMKFEMLSTIDLVLMLLNE